MATHEFVGDIKVTGNIKSPTTDASLYNLGAYDSVVDNGDGTVTVTRQTGYANSFNDFVAKNGFSWFGDGKPDWATARRSISTTRFAGGKSDIIANCPVLDGNSAWGYSGTSQIVISYEASKLSFYFQSGGDTNTPLEIQYKLAVSYTETVIEDRPLSQLSADGEKYIRGLYDKSLNQCKTSKAAFSNTYLFLVYGCHLKPNTTYTMILGASLGSGYMVTCAKNTWDETIVLLQNYWDGLARTFTTPATVAEADDWIIALRGTFTETTDKTFMLVEGAIARPFASYDASGHIGNSEAQLLLDEYEKTTNLLCLDNKVMSNGFYGGSLSFVSNNGYDVYAIFLPAASYHFYCTVDSYGSIVSADVAYTPLANIVSEKSFTAYTDYPFTVSGSGAVVLFSLNKSHVSQIMLNSGNSMLPFAPYDASGHITNDEAGLLLNEYQKTVNLFDTAAYRGDYTGNNASTIWQNNGTAILRTTGSSDPYAWGTDVIMLPAGTYTLSLKRSIAGAAAYIYVPKSGQSHYTSLGTAAGLLMASFTVDGNTQMRIRFGGDNSGSNQDTVYSDFMLTKGDTHVLYTPYHGPIMHEGDAGVLLWQNATPNEAFAAQTITVADMSKYKYIVFAFKTYKTATWSLMYQKIKYDLSATGGTTLFLNDWNSDVSMIYPKCRFVKLTSATSVTFSTGYEKSTNQSADQVVPVAIYGTNIL